MRANPNPKQLPPRLPELRNLGTVLRILLAVNAFGLAAAIVREQRWGTVASAWCDTAALLGPHLLVNLLLLYSLAPWLERLPYRIAVACILALTAAVSFGLSGIFSAFGVDTGPGNAVRHAALTLLAAGTLLFYFHLRAKA